MHHWKYPTPHHERSQYQDLRPRYSIHCFTQNLATAADALIDIDQPATVTDSIELLFQKTVQQSVKVALDKALFLLSNATGAGSSNNK